MEEQRDRSIQGLLFQVARRYFSRSFGALEKIGRTVTAEEVIAEVKKDRTFYEKPGPGGITISGGDP